MYLFTFVLYILFNNIRTDSIFGELPDYLKKWKNGLKPHEKSIVLTKNYTDHIFISPEINSRYTLDINTIRYFTICDGKVIGNKVFEYYVCPLQVVNLKMPNSFKEYCCYETGTPKPSCCSESEFVHFLAHNQSRENVPIWVMYLFACFFLLFAICTSIGFYLCMYRYHQLYGGEKHLKKMHYKADSRSGYTYGAPNRYGRNSTVSEEKLAESLIGKFFMSPSIATNPGDKK